MSRVKLLSVPISKLNGRWFNHGVVRKTRLKYEAAPCLFVSVRECSLGVSGKEKGLHTGRKNTLRAAHIAQKLRHEKEESKKQTNQIPASPVQRRIAELKQSSQQLQYVHPNVFAKALSRSILYQNQNLIAINKPYGVPVYNTGGVTNSITASLSVLAKMIDGMRAGSQLHVCYSLEKDTTGVLFLARSEETAECVQSLVRSHQAERKYMVITVGVPVPSEGVIDIPIIEKEVTGAQRHFKMGLSPLYRVTAGGDEVVRVRAHRQAHSAVTQYKVLDSNSGCSLLELRPVTGVKHQLRVHTALGLACPILGDHKYANWNKLAPQKLPDRVLRRLELDQNKTRHLPLHLHVRQITLPGLGDHGDLTVSCPLPRYFVTALKKLQIELPEKP